MTRFFVLLFAIGLLASPAAAAPKETANPRDPVLNFEYAWKSSRQELRPVRRQERRLGRLVPGLPAAGHPGDHRRGAVEHHSRHDAEPERQPRLPGRREAAQLRRGAGRPRAGRFLPRSREVEIPEGRRRGYAEGELHLRLARRRDRLHALQPLQGGSRADDPGARCGPREARRRPGHGRRRARQPGRLGQNGGVRGEPVRRPQAELHADANTLRPQAR